MELLSAEFKESWSTREFLSSAEFACLEETCLIAAHNLSDKNQSFCDKVAKRCLHIGQIMNLGGSDLVRIEVAARVHRIGESFIDIRIRGKNFLDLTQLEFQAYRQYPIFSALRLSQHVSREFYEILLNHREYYSIAGFLNNKSEDKIPLSSRILCVATEYEELLMYKGNDPVSQDTIERRMMKNTIGRYDPAILDPLMRTITAENLFH